MALRPIRQRIDQARRARDSPRSNRAPSGRGRPAACAIAGTWSSRFVEPPKAACTTMALRIEALVRTSRPLMPASGQLGDRLRGAGREIEPHRLAGRRERRVRQRHARALRPPPAKSPPCRETGSLRPASRRRGSRAPRPPPASAPRARNATPMVCTAPASSPRSGGSVTPPGTSTDGQIAHRRPAPSAWPAGPCRRWRRRPLPRAAAASGSAGGRRSPRHCDTAGCRTSRWSPACGRRTDRSSSRKRAPSPSRRNSRAAASTCWPISQCPV